MQEARGKLQAGSLLEISLGPNYSDTWRGLDAGICDARVQEWLEALVLLLYEMLAVIVGQKVRVNCWCCRGRLINMEALDWLAMQR